MKRIVAAVVISLAVLVFPGVQAFASENGLLDDYTDKTVVLQSNDVHGNISGYQYMAGLRDELEKRGADVIIVDSGDYLQGAKEVAVNKGENAIRMMDKVGYDLATIGNHEFDFSYNRLRELLENAKFDVICDSIRESDGESAFAPSKIIEGDVKVGFIGVATPETQTKTSPSNLNGVTFLSDKTELKLFDKVEADIADLKEKNVDVILCVSHLGVKEESVPNRSVDLWAQVKDSGLDYILDGHSHSVMTQGDNGEPIISTGTKFQNIGVVTIDEKTGDLDKEAKPFLYKVTEDSYTNAEVKAESDKINEEIAEAYDTKVATTEVDLNGERNAELAAENGSIFPNGNRDGETNFGDLAADALKWYALKDGKTYDVPSDHVVGLLNGGAIRDGIGKGDITRGDLLSVFPFFNTIEGVYVTGAQILEAFEASTFRYPGEVGGFPQVSGIKYTIDSSKPYEPAAETYAGSTYYPPKSIKRVTIESINDKPFSKTDKYLVVTNSFITDGGDTYGAFQGMPKITICPLEEDVYLGYISEELNGVIGETYLEPQGRILNGISRNKVVLTKSSFTYNGKVQKPEIKTIGGRELVENKDYTAEWSGASSKNAGTYQVTIKGIGKYTGTTKAEYKINKAKNTLSVKGKTYKIKASKLRKKSKKLKASTVIRFLSKGQGTRTYKKISGTKKIKINTKTGKVTLKKGLKKGKYTIKVKVKAAGGKNYFGCTSKAIKIKVRVK